MDELVENYVKLRDAKAQLKAEYDGKRAKLDEVMDQIEGNLLLKFQELGCESVRTAVGTAYKSTRCSATVADWDTILDHVQQTDNWTLLDHRISKKAVEEYKEENGELPPGVNWREEVVVNVRRS